MKSYATSSGNSSDDDEGILPVSDTIRKRKRQRQDPHQSYMNLHFILGSSAEIERLFSIIGGIMDDNRRKIVSLLFESLLFLKINGGCWDLRTIVTAMSNA